MSRENVEIATRAIVLPGIDATLARSCGSGDPGLNGRAAFPKGTEGAGSVFRGHEGIREAYHRRQLKDRRCWHFADTLEDPGGRTAKTPVATRARPAAPQ